MNVKQLHGMGYVYKKMTASTVGICIVLELSIHLKNAMNLPAQAKCQSYWFKKTNSTSHPKNLKGKFMTLPLLRQIGHGIRKCNRS